MPARRGGCLHVGFALFWCGLTLLFDAVFGWQFIRQALSTRYPSVPGVVTHSELVVEQDDEGTSYRVGVRYDYRVNNRPYTGDRYRYMANFMSYGAVRRIVESLPVGKRVRVFYRPERPADSILSPGVAGGDLLAPLFLLPFNVIGIGLVLGRFPGGEVFAAERSPGAPAAGRPIRRRGGRQSIRLRDTVPPFLAALATAGGLAFGSLFVILLTLGGQPSLAVALSLWGVIVAASAGVYLFARVGYRERCEELVIDEVRGTASLPASCGRTSRVEVPVEEIQRIEIEQRIRATGSGITVYSPTLICRNGGTERREPVVEWANPSAATALAGWLAEELRVPAGMNHET